MVPNITKVGSLPGKLIIFEGPDGSGKTTQAVRLRNRLKKEGHKVTISHWKDAAYFGPYFKYNHNLKLKHMIQPETNLFLQAADLLYRLEKRVIPALARGEVVILDRGLETLVVRGKSIGYTEDQITNGLCWFANSIYKELFANAGKIYFSVSPQESLLRIHERSKKEVEQDAGAGTLLSAHLINSLKYAPDGDKMTRNKKRKMIRALQEGIVTTYEELFKGVKDIMRVDGTKGRNEIGEEVHRYFQYYSES